MRRWLHFLLLQTTRAVHGFCFESRSVGHAMQPVAYVSAGDDRRGLADENEKRCLEGILGICLVAQDAAADAEDHGTMPPHQGFKSRLVPLADKTVQQFAIEPRLPFVPAGCPLKVSKDPIKLSG